MKIVAVSVICENATNGFVGDMMIRIRFPDDLEASIEAGRWSCEDSRLERLLNAMANPWEQENGNDLSQAEIVSRVLGVQILEPN